VELVNIRDWYYSSTSGRLLIKWDKFDLSYAESDLVDIELWGYYEDDSGPHWDFIQVGIFGSFIVFLNELDDLYVVI
jgi:hypothetical protein